MDIDTVATFIIVANTRQRQFLSYAPYSFVFTFMVSWKYILSSLLKVY